MTEGETGQSSKPSVIQEFISPLAASPSDALKPFIKKGAEVKKDRRLNNFYAYIESLAEKELLDKGIIKVEARSFLFDIYYTESIKTENGNKIYNGIVEFAKQYPKVYKALIEYFKAKNVWDKVPRYFTEEYQDEVFRVKEDRLDNKGVFRENGPKKEWEEVMPDLVAFACSEVSGFSGVDWNTLNK